MEFEWIGSLQHVKESLDSFQLLYWCQLLRLRSQKDGALPGPAGQAQGFVRLGMRQGLPSFFAQEQSRTAMPL